MPQASVARRSRKVQVRMWSFGRRPSLHLPRLPRLRAQVSGADADAETDMGCGMWDVGYGIWDVDVWWWWWWWWSVSVCVWCVMCMYV